MPTDAGQGTIAEAMHFADSHVHLADAAFAEDADAVIERARAAGARALVCIGESLEAAARARVIAARHPGLVFHTAGVHPHDAGSWDSARDADAVRAAVRAGAVAIGECGLDYHYDHSPRDVQRRTLDAQLQLAAECARPLVVHTREAEADTIDFLREASAAGIGGVLHCFTGSSALAEAGLEAGWCISFSGIITFRSWSDDEILRRVPDDRLLVESDAPYLAPVPNRGKRNESAWVPLTIARLARARGVSALQLAAMTLRNTQRFFALPPSGGA
jgi:TatD DNase family protein